MGSDQTRRLRRYILKWVTNCFACLKSKVLYINYCFEPLRKCNLNKKAGCNQQESRQRLLSYLCNRTFQKIKQKYVFICCRRCRASPSFNRVIEQSINRPLAIPSAWSQKTNTGIIAYCELLFDLDLFALCILHLGPPAKGSTIWSNNNVYLYICVHCGKENYSNSSMSMDGQSN